MTSHSNTKYGLRVDVNGGTSELKCSNFEIDSNIDMKNKNITNANNISSSAITLNGTDLTTTINNIDLTYGGKLTNFTTGPAAPRLEISGAQLTLATNINMNGYEINNIGYLFIKSGSNASEISQNSVNLWIRNNQSDARIQLINLTNGGLQSRAFDISYSNVNFDNRTLSNCPTITNISNDVSTINNNIALRVRAQCRVKCTSGVYSMDWINNNTFRMFQDTGLYFEKLGAGRFKMIVSASTGITDANFTVTATGTNKVGATTGGDTMLFNIHDKEIYHIVVDGVLVYAGYIIYVITTKTNTADSAVDVGNLGFLDFTVFR